MEPMPQQSFSLSPHFRTPSAQHFFLILVTLFSRHATECGPRAAEGATQAGGGPHQLSKTDETTRPVSDGMLYAPKVSTCLKAQIKGDRQ